MAVEGHVGAAAGQGHPVAEPRQGQREHEPRARPDPQDALAHRQAGHGARPNALQLFRVTSL